MDKYEDNDLNKVITGKFKTDHQSQSKFTERAFSSQSNPIKNNLNKLVHGELHKNKFEYNSFSRFRPEDLR